MLTKKRALCIKCGTFKGTYSDACPSCNFLPTEDIDLAKSRILDFPYDFTFGREGDVVETGRTVAELEKISEQIKRGQPFDFPPEEVEGLVCVLRDLKQTSLGAVLLSFIKWIAPPLALAIGFAILVWTR